MTAGVAFREGVRIDALGRRSRHAYPQQLVDELTAAYANEDGPTNLTSIAKKWGKNKGNLCRAAKALGLSVNPNRRKVEQRKDRRKYGDWSAFLAVASEVRKRAIAKHGHARGMLGKRHSAETRQHLSSVNRARWAAMSPDERDEIVNRNLKAAIAKNGRIGPIVNKRETTWKAGWRDVGDKRHYFRSRWEANYARYLQWLKERGEILDWEYEPETFWFEPIKRGVRSYLPDFRVHELNGSKPLHEVKGWMDARSRTTLKRMAKYHPQETIIVVREKEYRGIARAAAALIGGWE